MRRRGGVPSGSSASKGHVFPKGYRPITLRQVYMSFVMVCSIGYFVYKQKTDDTTARRDAYFKHFRAKHIDANSQNIGRCAHNPMMKAPREDMIIAFRSLYPFPEYQATCRGDDEEVGLYMIEEDQLFHSRYDNGELYFKAKRGFLDYLLITTWENRFDYGIDLFRSDRRPIVANAKNIVPYIAYYAPVPIGVNNQQESSESEADPSSSNSPNWDNDFEMIKTTSNFLFSFRPVGDTLEASTATCTDAIIDHAVILDPNPITTGSSFLVPFYPENRLNSNTLTVDSIQVALCFVRELLDSDVRMVYNPLSPYNQLHFKIWPLDESVNSHVTSIFSWTTSETNSKQLPLDKSSKTSLGVDPNTGVEAFLFEMAGSTGISWKLDKSTAPVLSYAVAHCSSVIQSNGFIAPMLISSDWLYLWPRLKPTNVMMGNQDLVSGGRNQVGDQADKATSFTGILSSYPTTTNLVETLAGVVILDSKESLSHLSSSDVNNFYTSTKPPEVLLMAMLSQCVGTAAAKGA